jgi:hypothetical protein
MVQGPCADLGLLLSVDIDRYVISSGSVAMMIDAKEYFQEGHLPIGLKFGINVDYLDTYLHKVECSRSNSNETW